MLGEQASQTDCAVFGMLSQIHWQACGGASEKLYKSKCYEGRKVVNSKGFKLQSVNNSQRSCTIVSVKRFRRVSVRVHKQICCLRK